MIPLDPLKLIPKNTYEKARLDIGDDGFVKKATKHLYNGTVPFFLAGLVSIPCLGIATIAGLINIVTAPFVAVAHLSRKLSNKTGKESKALVIENPEENQSAPPVEKKELQRTEKIQDRTSIQQAEEAEASINQKPTDAPSSPSYFKTFLHAVIPTFVQNFFLGKEKPLPPAPDPLFVDLHGPNEDLNETSPGRAPSLTFDEDLPEEVADNNFPVTFRRELQPAGTHSPLERIESWPKVVSEASETPLKLPEEKQSSTTPFLRDFFSGTKTIPGSNVSLWSIFRQVGTPEGDDLLEKNLDVARLLLPTRENSKTNKKVPALSREMVHLLQTDPAEASKYIFIVLAFLKHWGAELDIHGKLQKTSEFEEQAQRVRDNPSVNHKQIARLIKSLSDCGYGCLAQEVLHFFKNNKKNYGLLQSNSYDSSFLVRTSNYLKQQQKQGYDEPPFHLKKWVVDSSDDENLQLDILQVQKLPSDGKPFPLTQDPKWFTTNKKPGRGDKDPLFFSEAPLLVWNIDMGKWDMPNLKAPKFFCTLQQQIDLKQKA